jgi:hypothetical protein
MDDFMLDRGFLQEVNKFRVKTYYAAIMLLDFATERPITQLEGRVVNGSMSVQGKSATRRTGSMQIVFDKATLDLTNVDNLISINKKFTLSIGVQNPFYDSGMYREYPRILYFKQGTFLITGANSSMSATSRTINIQFIDKMGMLNGVCGGTIPASVSLHDKILIDPDDNVTTLYPRIKQIIQEVVHHFGDEHPSKIIISDVPDFGRQVATWAGSIPAYFADVIPGIDRVNGSFVVGEPRTGYSVQKILGDDIGYMSTELTYPGELVMKAGTTVTGVLDEIVKTLGNYEYFYDVDGYFHFQRIANFDKTGQAPPNSAFAGTPFNIVPELDEMLQTGYLPKFPSDQFLNEFSNSDMISQASLNPAYANIKNDFVVWGSRKLSKDEEYMCRYHLAIDERPNDEDFVQGTFIQRSLCRQWIWVIRDKETKVIRCYVNTTTNADPVGSYDVLTEEALMHSPSLTDLPAGAPRFDWREELYRRALIAYNSSTRGSYYDEELMAEWRLIFNPFTRVYDPMDGSFNPYTDIFESEWVGHYGGAIGAPPWNGYNVDVVRSPQKIRYWLDIIDTNSGVGQYSVGRIGRRSVVKENNKINEVLNREVPDIVFIDGTLPPEEITEAELEFQDIGQAYCIVKSDYLPYFSLRNSFGTCYEEVRDLFYLHLIYNAQVSITSIPILYLDVNKVVRLNFPELGIVGNFIINQISWSLGNMATMQISTSEAVVIV